MIWWVASLFIYSTFEFTPCFDILVVGHYISYPQWRQSGAEGYGFHCYLSVCLIYCIISQKPMQLGSPNLTNKCSTMSPGNAFILGSKGQMSRSQVTKTVPAWVFALLWMLASCNILQASGFTKKKPALIIPKCSHSLWQIAATVFFLLPITKWKQKQPLTKKLLTSSFVIETKRKLKARYH